MARSRVLKPGFFQDEDLADCQPFARLLFAGLWTIADREGRLEDRPRRINAALFPYDALDIDALLDELVAVGSIRRYVVDGVKVIDIPAFLKYQKVHFREQPSTLPPPKKHRNTSKAAPNHGPAPTQPLPSRPASISTSTSTSKALSLVAARPAGANDPFTTWWNAYGKVGSRADAQVLYSWWRGQGASAEELLAAAVNYRRSCTSGDCKMKHGRTFLAKQPNRWREWADGEAHGSMDPAGASRLDDVLEAAALAYPHLGLGWTDERDIRTGPQQRHLAAGETAGGSLPARELEGGE